ncbi:MAG: dockerin type I domain-containing protein [Phycisphaerae bacterium]|nr:dockerin type I domain-containing protein [Phycisphaerae bacterium]
MGFVDAATYRISDDGTITGYGYVGSTELLKLIVWRPDGSVEVHEIGGAEGSVTTGVTRSDGVIFGEYQGGPGGLDPFILNIDGPDELPGAFAGAHGGMRDVSAGGLVTGRWFEKSFLFDAKPFIWAAAPRGRGAFVVLPTPPGLQYGWGMRIDDFGRVAGSGQMVSKDPFQAHWQAFYCENGAYTMLGTLPGDLNSRVRDANSVGQVVGQSSLLGSSNGLPFLWQHGVMVPLSSLVTLPGIHYPRLVSAVNDKGTIAVNSISKMFIMRPLGVVPSDIDLNCKVNVDDLKLLLECWGDAATSPVKHADINGDGFVNASDLSELLGAWTP